MLKGDMKETKRGDPFVGYQHMLKPQSPGYSGVWLSRSVVPIRGMCSQKVLIGGFYLCGGLKAQACSRAPLTAAENGQTLCGIF